jgi:hypothetical protein
MAGNQQRAKKGKDGVEPKARMPVREPCREAVEQHIVHGRIDDVHAWLWASQWSSDTR